MEILKKCILEYVSNKDNNSAFLITGEWGAGKTFFIKNNIIPVLKKLNKPAIYISLNGLTSSQQIDKMILINYLRIPNSEVGSLLYNFTGKMSKTLTSIFSATKFNFDITSINFTPLINFNDTVFIFDDLERVSEKFGVKDALGYINSSFIESKSYKVLILGNTNKVEDLSKNILEKVVGRQVIFKYTYHEILVLYLDKYKQKPLHLFLQKHTELLVYYFTQLKINNLRTISFFMQELEKYVNTKIILDKDIWEKVFLFTLILTNELKDGQFVENENDKKVSLQGFSEKLFHFDIYERHLGEVTDEDPFAYEIYKKYSREILYNLSFFNSIYKSVIWGIFDADEFVEEFQHIESKKYYESFNKLIDFLTLSEPEILQYAEVIFEGIEKNLFRLYSHFNLFRLLTTLSNLEILKISEDDIFNKIIRAIENLEISSEDEANLIHLDDVDQTKLLGLEKQLFDILHEKGKSFYSENKKIQFFQLLDEIKKDSPNIDLFKNNLIFEPLSTYCNSKEIICRIHEGSNGGVTRFARFLRRKYKDENYRIKADKKLIADLIEEVQNFLEKEPLTKLRKKVIENLLEILIDIASKLN